jgi:hypothetical protein
MLEDSKKDKTAIALIHKQYQRERRSFKGSHEHHYCKTKEKIQKWPG